MIKKSLPLAMVFFSGLAALVYQVLWMRQLGLLFGNTAHASAVTLGAFFFGLAVGNWFWGRRMAARPNPLRVYAWLEVGIAVSALLYFGVIGLFQLAYPWVYQSLGYGIALFAFKCLLALILVCPPAFFMGGTIPAMGQSLVAQKKLFGTTAARIYGINTLGAALGVFLAAFLCVPLLGFTITCLGAMLVTSLIAVSAFLLSRGWQAGDPGDGRRPAPATEPPVASLATATAAMRAGKGRKKSRKAKKKRKAARPLSVETADPPPVAGLGRPAIVCLAFLSGFSVLALEVLWTRLFAQIHENSVYSFATVLIIVLACLSLGALLAAGLAKLNASPRQTMALLMLLGGVSLALFPKLFLELTNDLTMLPTHTSFTRYVGTLFLVGFSTIGPSCLLMGTVFPFLMKSEERFADCPGRSIGYVAAIDTVGAILGSVICGFFLLKFLGMWWTVRVLATLYLIAAVVLAEKSRAFGMALSIGSAAFLVLTYAVQQPGRLPVIGVNPNRGPYRIVETWETADCSIAVAETTGGNLAIKLNSNYVLGSTDATLHQVLQARIPLFAFPDTKSIFFLGLGTGITAGGALDRHLFPAVERVVACELVPEVVVAAKKYMTDAMGGVDFTQGLFEDPRVEILIEDGRHYLMATKETFDMINADLFLPYRSGAGSLYSRENYERARDRLNTDGVYVQWLPLYQLTEFEFGTISRTMLSVFDRVTLWRNNFVPGREIVALVGHKGKGPLPAHESARRRELPASVVENGWRNPPNVRLPVTAANIMLFYAGNMTASKELFDSYPVNTDDRPIIEYRAPLSIRRKVPGGMPPTLVGPQLAAHIALLLDACPPDRDPMLANQTAANRRLPLAGAAFHEAWIAYVLGDPQPGRRAWNAFVAEWTAEPWPDDRH